MNPTKWKHIGCKFKKSLLLLYLTLLTAKSINLKKLHPKKNHKHICIFKCNKKTLEAFRLPKIFIHPGRIKKLPNNLQEKENIPTITYKLGNTVINKILNYKKALNSIDVDEEILFSLNTDPCDCEKSGFCDLYREHIITGDVTII